MIAICMSAELVKVVIVVYADVSKEIESFHHAFSTALFVLLEVGASVGRCKIHWKLVLN